MTSPANSPEDPEVHDTGAGWRAASLWALAVAGLCFLGLRAVMRTPHNGDWVTGAFNFFAMLALQGTFCALGVLFGVLELARPYEQRHRWSGAALWANVLLILGIVSWLMLTRPAR